MTSANDPRVTGYKIGYTEEDDGAGAVRLYLSDGTDVTLGTTRENVFLAVIEVLKLEGDHYFDRSKKLVYVVKKGF